MGIFCKLFILFVLNGVVYAQESSQIILNRSQSPITLDGIITDFEWDKIEPLEMVMFLPTFGEKPTENSDVRITFDDDYIYIGARLFDSEPHKIQVTNQKRDDMELSNDAFGVFLDTFNDKENGLGFFTNPVGARWDFTIFNDAIGEFPVNPSWNTFWDVETSRDEKGWFVEMRVPFSSLRYEPVDNQVTMGLIIWRWIARKNESSLYPAIPNKWGWWSQWKVSRAREAVFSKVEEKKPLYIAPYFLAGFEVSNELNQEETAYVKKDEFKRELGLDLKYGLTSNLTMDLTLNTDFAQVEADNQQVNLSRFSLFFPEKRLFFQERASIFDIKLGGQNRLFYSRRIGLYEDEDGDFHPVSILGGARLMGKIGNWDIGFLDMQTASFDSLGSENFGVLRLRHQVLNDNSYLGTLISNRLDPDGIFNTGVALDAVLKIGENEYLSLTAAQTFENDAKNDFALSDQMRMQATLERSKSEGLGYELSVSRQGVNYNPALGFSTREDYYRYGTQASYGLLATENDWMQRQDIYTAMAAYFRNSDKSVETMEFNLGWSVFSKKGYEMIIGIEGIYDDLTETIELSDDALVDPGSYDFFNIETRFNTPYGGLWNLQSKVEFGQFYDGTLFSFEAAPRWFISKNLNINLAYVFNHIDFKNRTGLDAHVIRLRSAYTLSTKTSFSGFIQYNSEARLSIANLRFRYNPKEGNDLYLVYNEDFNSDRKREIPNLPASSNRTILLKYTYTFVY